MASVSSGGAAASSNAQRARYLAHHQLVIAEGRKADERSAVRKRRRGPPCNLEGKSGLARSAGSAEHEQAHVVAEKELVQLVQLALSSEKRVRRGR